MSLEDIRAYKKVGERRFREVRGLYYEDVVIGEIVEHRPGRTVTEADNLWQSLLALNPNPLHIDAAYAANTEWGRPLVSSLVTLSIVTGMSVNSTSFLTTANLGWEEVRLLAPVFVGDTLYAESEFLDKRLSRSRPHQGLVTCATRGLKADGTVVLTFRRTFLLPTREHGAAEAAGY
jgi:itaconyl-CoA hydratase